MLVSLSELDKPVTDLLQEAIGFSQLLFEQLAAAFLMTVTSIRHGRLRLNPACQVELS